MGLLCYFTAKDGSTRLAIRRNYLFFLILKPRCALSSGPSQSRLSASFRPSARFAPFSGRRNIPPSFLDDAPLAGRRPRQGALGPKSHFGFGHFKTWALVARCARLDERISPCPFSLNFSALICNAQRRCLKRGCVGLAFSHAPSVFVFSALVFNAQQLISPAPLAVRFSANF